MKEKLYKIRPLKWKKEKTQTLECYTADVPMWSYEISRERENFEETGEWGKWRWIGFFDSGDEAYNDSEYESLEECKKKVWQDWIKRITPALIEVKNK